MRQNVAIFGDSWGCGEWSVPSVPNILHNDRQYITHLGLEQYFKDLGHTTFNMSVPGSSNRDSIENLTKFLTAHNTDTIVLFIITEPTRNFQPDYVTFKQDIIANDGLLEFRRKTLISDLVILNKLAQQHNQTFRLIGGLGSVPDIDQFGNLSCLCRSWPELLAGNLYTNVDFDHFGIWEQWLIDGEIINNWITTTNLHQFDSKFIDKFVKQLDQLHTNQIVLNHPLFYPDYAHPNREGHKILFEYIRKKLGI